MLLVSPKSEIYRLHSCPEEADTLLRGTWPSGCPLVHAVISDSANYSGAGSEIRDWDPEEVQFRVKTGHPEEESHRGVIY